MSGKPLERLRILSLAEQYPGPYATLLLADLGADVVLVERPRGGDPARGVSHGFFEALNRNKRSIAIDLKHPAGRELFLELADEADVVLEGFRPGTMDRLGLGAAVLAQRNPRLIYVSISGFGQDGPLRDRLAHDLTFQAMAGLLHDRLRSGDAGGRPALEIGDLSSGLFAAVGTLAGLLSRERTGRGSHVDVSMFDGLVSLMTALLVPAINGMGAVGLPRQPAYGLFDTADGGMLSLSIAHEDRFWRELCDATGLGEDAAELPLADRETRFEELRGRLAERLRQESLAYWLERFDGTDICFGPVRDIADVEAEPHLAARRMIVEVAADGENPAVRHVRQPLRVDGTAPGPTRHAPALGQHTVAVLARRGLSEARIEELLRTGVVVQGEKEKARRG